MQMSAVIAVHMSAALGALALGPVVLWSRLRPTQRPRLHRAMGYAWVTLMMSTALSAIFIRDFRLPNIGGFTPIHLLVPAVFFGIARAFWKLSRGNVRGHRISMQVTYLGGCVVAGAFTLLPHRYLGHLVRGQWLGLS